MKAPDVADTARLRLRRPLPSDAEAIFARYAADPEVTAFLSWPRHRSLQDSRTFLELSEAEWERWPAGPYLVVARASGVLLGSTGFAFAAPELAVTGYVLARDAWGHGYATEALGAVVALAPILGLRRLAASCHAEHAASVRVLLKCGFAQEALQRGQGTFPNLTPNTGHDVLSFVRVVG